MIEEALIKLTALGKKRILDDLLLAAADTVTPGLVNAVYVGLFTAWPGWNEGLLTPDLTAPLYGGYARQLIVWGSEAVDDLGRNVVYGTSLRFTPTDSSASSTILGAALYSALVAGNLYGAVLFPTPVVLGVPADQFSLTPKFAVPLGNEGTWGEMVLVR